MHPPDLEDRVKKLLAAARERSGAALDTEYQQTFEEEGQRKSEYIITDLLEREKGGELTTKRLLYFCVGGADGSEIENVLRTTEIRHAVMIEISDRACDLARERSRRLSEELDKEFRVIHGDVTTKLQDISDTLSAFRRDYDLNGIVCSAQAVLHELPQRSPHFDFSVFFGKIFYDPAWEVVAFYSREPCMPPGWPEVVELHIQGLSGDSLRRFALYVADRLKLPQKAEDIANNWVQLSGILAVELIHKLLRNETTAKINYELDEQLTGFDPSLIEKIIRNHVLGIDIAIQPTITEGFRKALELHHVQFRDPNHNRLLRPLTHVQIIGFRPSPIQMLKSRSPDSIEQGRPGDDEHEHSNLGAPPYSRFVRREKYFGEIVEGLNERTTPVLITGMSGVGKTSLAHEVAANSLTGSEDCPRFNAVVWVSDKANPGSTTLDTVLDEIAHTLDYAGWAKLELPQKRRQIESLCRRLKILIIVDSFESVTDTTLSSWLCSLPEPSKALVTTLKRDSQFPETVTDVHVLGMNDEETREFVEQRLSRLKLEVTDYSKLHPLLNIIKGNPKAIEIALGIIKRKGRQLTDVIDSLSKAKPPFDEFCSGAWALLDHNARRLLLSTYYFPYGTQNDALKRVAQCSGVEFEQAIELLCDLGQLDIRRRNLESAATYSTHGLVNAFVGARLDEDVETQTKLRHNWLAYLKETVAGIGLCWNDIGRLEILDDQSLRQTVLLAIDWSLQHAEYTSTIAIARDVRYYFYVRGFWSNQINLTRAHAAKLHGDAEEEFSALTYHVNITSKQRNLAGIEEHLLRLRELVKLHQMSHQNMIGYQHSLALYALAQGDYPKAEKAWINNLAGIDPTEFPHEYSANLRWLAVCYEKQERTGEAHELLARALAHAQGMNFKRGVIDILLKQASLYIKERAFSEAATKLDEITPLLNEVQDRCYDAQYADVEARVCDADGRLFEAVVAYEKAVDLYERLGMNDRALETKLALDAVKRTLDRSSKSQGS